MGLREDVSRLILDREIWRGEGRRLRGQGDGSLGLESRK